MEERAFKSGTILTDGINLIYLGIAHEKNWTPENNYGRKNTDYTACRTYPKTLAINRTNVIYESGKTKGIYGLWFQKGYHLENFIEINKKLIDPNILTELIKQ